MSGTLAAIPTREPAKQEITSLFAIGALRAGPDSSRSDIAYSPVTEGQARRGCCPSQLTGAGRCALRSSLTRVRGPNFFLVGAAKSGTTALYHALRRHDDVYLPETKESHVYAYLADPPKIRHLFASEAAARRRFAADYAAVANQPAIGDASTSSLAVDGTAAAIAADVPAARIVAILRHPVDRAFSHWRHFLALGLDRIADFGEVVALEERRRAAGIHFAFHYLHWGRYSSQLPQFLEQFGRERVLVHLYDDLCADSAAVLRQTLRFVGADATGPIEPVGRHNEVLVPRSLALQRALRGRGRAGRAITAVVPPAAREAVSTLAATRLGRKLELDPGLRAELTAGFADEISRLEELIDRDLSAWR